VTTTEELCPDKSHASVIDAKECMDRQRADLARQRADAGVGPHVSVVDAIDASAIQNAWAAREAAEQVVRSRPLAELRTAKQDAIVALRARLAEKQAEYDDFHRHGMVRWKEHDLHGAWDAAINATEVSSYMDGLRYALEVLGVKP